MGLIGLVATMANAQVLIQTSKNSDYTTASRQTLNAVHWISCDAQMAQDIEPDAGVSGFPLTLQWLAWDHSDNEVIYSLQNGKVIRSYSTDNGTPVVYMVAEYISENTSQTYCSFSDGILTLMMTGSVGEGANTTNVTKVRHIASRPNL